MGVMRWRGCGSTCQILSPFPADSPPPFSPQTYGNENVSTGLRKPITKQEAYRGVKGFKSPFASETS